MLLLFEIRILELGLENGWDVVLLKRRSILKLMCV